MNGRSLTATSLVACTLLCVVSAGAQERWVDDPAVLAPRRVRVSTGLGVAWLTFPGPSHKTQVRGGTGMNVEQAVGLGNHLEVGARFGERMEAFGRGLRADEVARGFDTETFGTGLSTVANPELRLRWGGTRWNWMEAGLEDRLVLPIRTDPNATELLGAWGSIHLGHIARIDGGINAVVTWQSFSAARVAQLALGVPVRVWANLTRGLFAGAIATTHYVAATRYTASYARVTTGVAAGYRLGPCDVFAVFLQLDALRAWMNRIGLGVDLSCRL